MTSLLNDFLNEIGETLKNWGPVPSAVLMPVDGGELRAVVSQNLPESATGKFVEAARLAVEKRKTLLISDRETGGPLAALPIMDWSANPVTVFGVLVLGHIPEDIEFYNDLVRQASLGVVNAKLFSEAEEAKNALEKKVKHLTALSQMGMVLQEPPLKTSNVQETHLRVLMKHLKQAEFQPVFICSTDLKSGILKTIRTDIIPDAKPIDKKLDHFPLISSLLSRLPAETGTYGPSEIFDLSTGTGGLENELFGLPASSKVKIALSVCRRHEMDVDIVVAGKDSLDGEDLDTFKRFIQYARLNIEKIEYSNQYQDKARNLTLVHQIGINLGKAASQPDRRHAIRTALEELANVLEVHEVSLYSFWTKVEKLKLIAYSSVTAVPGKEPVEETELKTSVHMAQAVGQAYGNGGIKAYVRNDIDSQKTTRKRERFSTGAYMGVPLVFAGNPIGVLNVADKVDRGSFFADDAELAEIAAGMLSPYVYWWFL